jgi:hypothetical protein
MENENTFQKYLLKFEKKETILSIYNDNNTNGKKPTLYQSVILKETTLIENIFIKNNNNFMLSKNYNNVILNDLIYFYFGEDENNEYFFDIRFFLK